MAIMPKGDSKDSIKAGQSFKKHFCGTTGCLITVITLTVSQKFYTKMF